MQSFQRYSVPWTSLDICSSKGRTFTGPNHFLLDQKILTQFKCNILFSCIFIYMYVNPVFNFITPIFTKVIIIIIFAIFCMSWCRCSHRNPAIRDWSTTSRLIYVPFYFPHTSSFSPACRHYPWFSFSDSFQE